MKYSRMRELLNKPKLTKKDQKELNSAAAQPPCTIPKPPAEYDEHGNVVRPYPVGRSARRSYLQSKGFRDQVNRSRIQRLTRKRRTGGVQ